MQGMKGKHGIQCQRKPNYTPKLQELAVNFLATFFSRHPPSSARALYVGLSSLILPLPQPIRPSTINKALSGPLYTAIGGPYFPCPPPVGGSLVVCAGSEGIFYCAVDNEVCSCNMKMCSCKSQFVQL